MKIEAPLFLPVTGCSRLTKLGCLGRFGGCVVRNRGQKGKGVSPGYLSAAYFKLDAVGMIHKHLFSLLLCPLVLTIAGCDEKREQESDATLFLRNSASFRG